MDPHTDIARWAEQAAKAQPLLATTLTMPVIVFIHEAEAAAGFVRKYWDPAEGRPGLSEVALLLTPTIADDLESIARAARELYMRALLSEPPAKADVLLVETAEERLETVASLCEFVLDDGVSEPADDALAAVKAQAERDTTLPTLVQALIDFAGLAESLIDRLRLVSSFDPAILLELRQLAKQLGGRERTPGRDASPEIELRNRYLRLLVAPLARVRSAADYVFRKHPEIRRQAHSAYLRRRRAEAARRKLQVTPAQPKGE